MNLLLADSSAIQAEAFHVSGDLGTLGPWTERVKAGDLMGEWRGVCDCWCG